MTAAPIVFPQLASRANDGGLTAGGTTITVAEWPAGPGKGEVTGLHVHSSDDRAALWKQYDSELLEP